MTKLTAITAVTAVPAAVDASDIAFAPAPYAVEPTRQPVIRTAPIQAIEAMAPYAVAAPLSEDNLSEADAALVADLAPAGVDLVAPIAPTRPATSELAEMFQLPTELSEVDVSRRPSETDLRWVPPTRKQVAIRTAVTQGPLYLVICLFAYGAYLAYDEYKNLNFGPTIPTSITTAETTVAPASTSRPIADDQQVILPASVTDITEAESLSTPERLVMPVDIAITDNAAVDDEFAADETVAAAAPTNKESITIVSAAFSTAEPSTSAGEALAITNSFLPAADTPSEVIAAVEDVPGDATALETAVSDEDGATQERVVEYDPPKLRVSPLPLTRPVAATAAVEETPVVQETVEGVSSENADIAGSEPAETTPGVENTVASEVDVPQSPELSETAAAIIAAAVDTTTGAGEEAIFDEATDIAEETAIDGAVADPVTDLPQLTRLSDKATDAEVEAVEVAALDEAQSQEPQLAVEIIFSKQSPRTAPQPAQRP